jgi:dTDP-3-amino-3,4,6-trideoxy-alpha-D-glucose transaminase
VSVPFLDLVPAYEELREELDSAYRRVMESGWFVLGEEVSGFEREFAELCGVEHCVAVGSGLDALELMLRGYGVGPGDEVIVPGHTFVATWLGVSRAGATPVPVDIDSATYNIDPALVEAAIGERTRAIMPVHLYGLPAPLDELSEIAARHELLLLEDAAQAHGAIYRGRRAGSLGHAAGFSFYPGKNLGATGDGGCVTTGDADLAEAIRELRNYGSSMKYHHERKGFNSRLDELDAALLRVRLHHLEDWNGRRERVAERYRESFAGLPGLTLPPLPADGSSSWHLFVVRHADRDELQGKLADAGVQTIIHYPIAPHQTGAYAEYADADLPHSERAAAEVLSLPIGPHLAAEDQESVVSAVRKALDMSA